MRRGLFLVFFFIRAFLSNLGGEEASLDLFVHIPPKISLKVEELDAFEGKPIPLFITILHLNEDVIDPSSFLLNETPLAVQAVVSAPVGPSSLFKSTAPNTLYISTYKALLDPRQAGVYTIGPITVKLSGAVYQSDSISFNVTEAVVTRNFTLKSTIDFPQHLYPGQKIAVTYLIFFQDRVQILTEKLPLLELEGFSPLGAPLSEISLVGTNQFKETISREFRAVNPGTYVFEPSIVEGMKYVVQGDEHIVIPPLMRAKEEGKQLIVSPFPVQDKPSFFSGAIGSFTWRGRIVGSNKVEVEGSIEVEWRVTGRGDIDTVSLPPLQEDPLFSSRFLIDGEVKETRDDEGTKSFHVLLRPKTKDVREIPSLFFASFDPISEKYITLLTQPLALEVIEKVNEGPEEGKSNTDSLALLSFDPLLFKNVSEESQLTLQEVWYVALVFLLVGFVEKKMIRRGPHLLQAKKSRELFYEAFAKRSKRQEGMNLLKKALLLRLFETSLVQKKESNVQELSNKGLVGEVKRSIQDIDMYLYGKHEELKPIQKIWEEASLLFQAMKSLKERSEESHE